MNIAYQDPNFALGNFIMTTPAIRRLSDKLGHPVKVKFTKEYVKQCFIDCSFMDIVDEIPSKPIISSSMVNRNIPDYQYIYSTALGEPYSDQYHTYVDSPDEYSFNDKKYILILNGLAGTSWKGKKEVNEETHRFIAETTEMPLIFTGSMTDLTVNSPWMTEIASEMHLGNIRTSLALIRDAAFIISNDTGLSHAAGALNKNLLVLWKDTPFIKNQNPGKNTLYAHQHEWIERIQSFIKNNE